MKNKLLKTVGLVAVSSMLTFSQAALAEINISGWINEGVIFYDDGVNSDAVQSTDNGTTLASRINFSGDTDLGGLNAGFEVIIEPVSRTTPLIFANQSNFGDSNAHELRVLGNSFHIKGAGGKLTVGLQSMPTDNIAVLEDPSLTLWSGISPIFRGNGFAIQGAAGTVRAPRAFGAAEIAVANTNAFNTGVTARNAQDVVDAVIDGGGAATAMQLQDAADTLVAAEAALATSIAVAAAGNPALVNPGLARPEVADIDTTTLVNEFEAEVTAADIAAYEAAVRASGGSASDAPIWGDFLNCFTASGLRGAGGIGIDCNGIYRQGVRYDLPAFGPVGIAVGWANDDVYDIAAKYKGNMGSVATQFAIGYSINQGVSGRDGKGGGGTNPFHYEEAQNLQLQLGLAHAQTGLFGSFAYQHEEVDLDNAAIGNLIDHAPRVIANGADVAAALALDPMQVVLPGAVIADPNRPVGVVSDESDAWWVKVGIKKKWFSAGETSFAFDYGLYEDQYGFNEAVNGVTGSEVQRIGFSIDQYFGSNLILYGKWEQLELDVSGTATANVAYGGGDELSTFSLGGVYFF